MVRDAYKFFPPVLLIGFLFAFFNLPYLALVFFILSAFICYFFRNPKRPIPPGDHRIVSPADGKIVRISQTEDGQRTISIFLSIFNVHVNRSPISGQLQKLEYQRGRFKAAFNDAASQVNEQNILTISGREMQIVVRQIAGLIARRVVCWKQTGDNLARGELIGLIRFGSRVDITFPEKVKVLVKVGDRVRGGTSVLGENA